MDREKPNLFLHGVLVPRGLERGMGEQEEINQGAYIYIYMHIYITPGHKQYCGEGLGRGVGREGQMGENGRQL